MKFSVQRQVWLLLGVCLVVILTVVKPWQLYFLNDDFMHIPDARLWLRSGFMRPVPNVFLWIDKQLFGNSALGFFATTMLLQVGCVLVVFFTTNKIAARYLHPLPVGNLGFVTALLFMVYPWHAEAMMWVISRVSIMACLFTLASFYFYIDASRRPFLMMPALLFFLLALFSYESMWSAILFFGLFSILNVRRGYASTSQEALSFGVVAMVFAAYLVLRVVVLSTLAGDGYDEINTNLSNFGLLLGNGIKLFGRIFTPPFANSNYFLAVFALVLLVLLAAVAWAYKKNRLVFWALVVALAGMAAGVATAAPLGIDTHYNESERYLYYASYFYCFFCGTVIVLLVGKAVQGWVLFGLMGVFTILLANLQQNYRYASAITRTTMQTVAQYPSYNRAVFIDVPTKYKGSMVFRICLPHGIRWINPMAKYDSILIFNQVKSFERSENFETGVVDWPVLAKAKQWPSERAVLPGSDTLQSHDVVFWFKPEGIYKVNFTAPLPQTRE